MKNIGKWLYLLGLLVAVLAGLFNFSNSWLGLLLVLVGILAAIFFFETDDLVHMGIRFLVLFAVKDAFGGIPAIGTYLSGIFGAAYAFLAPIMLTLLVIFFFNKYFGAKK